MRLLLHTGLAGNIQHPPIQVSHRDEASGTTEQPPSVGSFEGNKISFFGIYSGSHNFPLTIWITGDARVLLSSANDDKKKPCSMINL